MSSAKKDDKKGASKMITLDYRGMVREVDGEKALPHTMSPLVATIFEQGVQQLVLQPGWNHIERTTWERYKSTHKQIAAMVKPDGETEPTIYENPRLPRSNDACEALIKRSYSLAGLEELERREKAGRSRKRILELIATQKRTPRCELEPRPYVSGVAPVLTMSPAELGSANG